MNISRREALGLAAASLIPRIPTGVAQPASFKLSYLTDIHLPNDPFIQERIYEAIDIASSNSDFVLFGGDNLMAIDHKEEADIRAQFDGWKRVMNIWLKKPSKAILGNHDVEQWESKPSVLNGKKRALDHFGMPGRYWSHKQNGWKIIGLDTVHQDGEGFKGWLDPEQLEWLAGELKDTKTPTMVVGHIPILTVTSLAHSDLKAKDKAFPIPFGSHVSNHYDAIKLFREAGNVKLVLSGHTHMQDRVDFGGTTYICAGAVCGGWWNGANQGFGPAFPILELREDGTFTHSYVDWENPG